MGDVVVGLRASLAAYRCRPSQRRRSPAPAARSSSKRRRSGFRHACARTGYAPGGDLRMARGSSAHRQKKRRLWLPWESQARWSVTPSWSVLCWVKFCGLPSVRGPGGGLGVGSRHQLEPGAGRGGTPPPLCPSAAPPPFPGAAPGGHLRVRQKSRPGRTGGLREAPDGQADHSTQTNSNGSADSPGWEWSPALQRAAGAGLAWVLARNAPRGPRSGR